MKKQKIEAVAEKYAEKGDNINAWADFVRLRFLKMADAKKNVQLDMGIALTLRDYGLDAFRKNANIFNLPYRSGTFSELVLGWVDEISENFPEVSLTGNTEKDREANEKAKGIERVLATMDENNGGNAAKLERAEDTAVFGTGILMERFNKDLVDANGKTENLESVRIDPRDFFIDEAATKIENARDCCVRSRLTKSEFLETYKDFAGIENVKFVQQTAKGTTMQDGSVKYFSADEIREGRDDASNVYYVVVYDYWNRGSGKRIVVANDTVIHEEDIFDLDFSVDYYIKWNTSFWGVGIIQKTAPEVFALDVYTELAFRNAKMAMQPVIVGDAGAGFHTGLKVAPGAIWVLPELGDKKIQDSFEQIRLGGIPGEFFSFDQKLQDNLTKSSRLDQRSLMANPSELATQTVSKKESGQKRVRGVVRRTMWSAESRRMKIRVRLFKKYIVPLNRSYEIKGYFVLRGDSENPTFIREPMASGNFKPSLKNTDVEITISVVDANKKKELGAKEREELSVALNSAITAVQVDPKVAEKLNLIGFFEMYFEALGIDKSRIYHEYKGRGEDEIEDEHLFLGMGAVVNLPEGESRKTSFLHIKQHRDFFQKEAKNLSSEALKNTIAHIEATWSNIIYEKNGQINRMDPSAEISVAQK